MKSAFASVVFTAFAAAVSAVNTVTFQSLDDVERTVYVTPNAGVEGVDPVTVPGYGSVDVILADGFIGNAYAVAAGSDNVPGMLAEFSFQSWGGITFFDVSAIVNPQDMDNVSEMYPADEPNTPVSGCASFPCDNAYYLPDDVQTKSTEQTHIIVTLGRNNAAASKRDTSIHDGSKVVARNFVVERY